MIVEWHALSDFGDSEMSDQNNEMNVVSVKGKGKMTRHLSADNDTESGHIKEKVKVIGQRARESI